MVVPTRLASAPNYPQLQGESLNINVSLPAGAACCCSVSVSTSGATSGAVVEPACSTCVTLTVSASPTSSTLSLVTPSPALPAMSLSPTASPRSLKVPPSPMVAMSRAFAPPQYKGSPVSLPTRRSLVSSPTAMSLSTFSTCHSASLATRNPRATLCSPYAQSREMHVERRASVPYPALSIASGLTSSAVSVVEPFPSLAANVASGWEVPDDSRVTDAPVTTNSLLPSCDSTCYDTTPPMSPCASSSVRSCMRGKLSPSSPAGTPLKDFVFDASQRGQLGKSWSDTTAASSDEELEEESKSEIDTLARRGSRAKSLCASPLKTLATPSRNVETSCVSPLQRLPTPSRNVSSLRDSQGKVNDDCSVVHVACHAVQDALREAAEAREKLKLALDLMDVAKPRARAIREGLHQATEDTDNLEVDSASVRDLTNLRERLKKAVASAKAFYFFGADLQASSQRDDASRAVSALKDAITVANSACALLREASEVIHKTDQLQGPAWREVLSAMHRSESDIDRSCSPFTGISHLQEIRHLLAEVLEVASDFRIPIEEVQEVERRRRKIHNVLQDLKGQVRVFCRLRDLTTEEKSRGECSNVKIIDETTLEVIPAGMYEFDRIFAPGTQEEVFQECRDLVQSAIDGRNVTVFTYGQTGSGKTYTMYGDKTDEGIAPRVVSELFQSIEKLRYNYDVNVTASMVELYQGKLYDMLCSRTSRGGKLRIRDDIDGAVWIDGLEEASVHDRIDLQAVLRRGIAQRVTASHAMNRESSRSHLIFTIRVSSFNRSTGETINGKILLCDLAGSERIKKTEVKGERQKEAIDINKSLTALGNVIMAVATKKQQIPYRNHKLTQLMRDSLGGTAKTLMIVNSSSSPSDLSQTISSLAYAARASRIYNQSSAKGATSSR